MTINDFLKICKGNSVVKKEKIQLEGDSYDIYNVYRNGKVAYAVEPDCEKECKVWRIWVYSVDFKTKEGIGIGNTLADVMKKYTIKELSTEGEGHISITTEEAEKISFFLDSSKLPPTWWSNPSLTTLNEDRKIDLIIVI